MAHSAQESAIFGERLQTDEAREPFRAFVNAANQISRSWRHIERVTFKRRSDETSLRDAEHADTSQ